MTGDDFAHLLNEFTHSAESGDGARFAAISPKTPSITTISMARIRAAPISRI